MDMFPPHEVVIERVIDGDTVVLMEPLFGVTKVRLSDIDTPEVRSAHCNREKLLGYEAKGYARGLLEGKTVNLFSTGKKGKWGRLLARVEIGGKDYSQLMVQKGYAKKYDDVWRSTPRDKRWCLSRDLSMPNQ